LGCDAESVQSPDGSRAEKSPTSDGTKCPNVPPPLFPNIRDDRRVVGEQGNTLSAQGGLEGLHAKKESLHLQNNDGEARLLLCPRALRGQIPCAHMGALPTEGGIREHFWGWRGQRPRKGAGAPSHRNSRPAKRGPRDPDRPVQCVQVGAPL
jgi:hypothetical protein